MKYQDIIDYENSANQPKLIIGKLVALIPFIIASILVLTHFIQVLLKPGYINEEGNQVVYLIAESVRNAGFGLAIILVLILVNKPIWKYAFTLLAIIAFSPIVDFYSTTYSFGFLFISIDLNALLILILHLVFNPEVFRNFVEVLNDGSNSEKHQKENFELAVNAFKSRFQNKSTEELKNIIKENTLVPEAIEAARLLLNENE